MPPATRKQDKAARRAKPGPVGKKGKTGGTGKKPKVFSESLGIAHLIQLSNDISAEQASKLDERVERAKGKQAWQKERNVKKNGGGKGGDAEPRPTKALPSSAVPMSKTGIRASILAEQREKKKKRKEARKAAFNASKAYTSDAEDDDDKGGQGESPVPKRVKFA